MNKNLVVRTDDFGDYICCPYCEATLFIKKYYRGLINMQRLRTDNAVEPKEVTKPRNRYGMPLNYCVNCGNKLNWKNLERRLLKEQEDERKGN